MDPISSDDGAAGSPPARRWGLAAACAAGVLLLLALAPMLPLALAPGLRLAAQAGGTATLLTLLAVGCAALTLQPVGTRLGLRHGRAGPGLVLVLAVGLLGLSHAVDQGIDLFGLRDRSHLAQYDAAVAAEPAGAWPWMLLGLGVAPGIGEELFFRGLLQRGLVARLGRGGAVVATAAIFGAFHGEPVHAVGAFALGLYLGSVAEITGGTRASIACHVANNLAAVGGVALPRQGVAPPLVLMAVGLALSVLALYTAQRHLARPD